jgi:putative transposase
MLAYSGVIVTYAAIRQWTLKFGQDYANTLRRRQPRPGDKWHLDEVVLTIKGQHHYLWRAVDQHGYTLDILTQSECRQTFLPQTAKKGWPMLPRVIITDKLKSYTVRLNEK